MNAISDIQLSDMEWFAENLFKDSFWFKFSPLNNWETNVLFSEELTFHVVVTTVENQISGYFDKSFPIYRGEFDFATFEVGINNEGEDWASCIEHEEWVTTHTLRNLADLMMELIAYVNCVLQTAQEKVTTQKARLPARYQQLENGQTIKVSDPRKVKLYTLPDLRKVKGLKSAIKKVRRCLCWETRGHWRHYQNGKTIWIKPCVKGPDRLKYKPKGREYDLGTSL